MSAVLLPIGEFNLVQVIAGSGRLGGAGISRTASPALTRSSDEAQGNAASAGAGTSDEKWDDNWGKF
jgi:hypothetical protein